MVLYTFNLANSATSLVCFGVGTMVMAALGLELFNKRPRAVHVLVVVAVSVCLFALFDGSSLLVSSLGRDTTLTGRTGLWAQLVSMNSAPLLGTGFETFWLGPRAEAIWRIYWWHPNQAHNGYLEILLNLGGVGVLLLGVQVVGGYINVTRSLRDGQAFGRFRLALLMAALLLNVTEAAFKVMHPVWIAFLIAAANLREPTEAVSRVAFEGLQARNELRSDRVSRAWRVLPVLTASQHAIQTRATLSNRCGTGGHGEVTGELGTPDSLELRRWSLQRKPE
jgi:O-antigen ligase